MQPVAALTTETEAGPRISLGALFASFTPEQRRAWDRYAGTVACDEYGLLVEGVEKFFESLPAPTPAA